MNGAAPDGGLDGVPGEGARRASGAEAADVDTPTAACHQNPPGYGAAAAGTKDALSKRLRRIEGQVRGVEKMVDDERYCIDVLTQITAIQSGLKAVALGLLDDHLAHCVVDAARAGGEQQATKLAEVSEAIARLVR